MLFRSAFYLVACFGVLSASVATGEMFRWTDAQGRVHYSDQPLVGSEAVELDADSRIQTVSEPTRAEPSEAVKKAREKRREVQRYVDRENRKASRRGSGSSPLQRVMPTADGRGQIFGGGLTEESRERQCQRNYGKSCRELERWKSDATADCKRRNLSQDCKSDEYLTKRRPRTVEEQARIDEKRQKREDRRWRKTEREIDALRRR